MKHLYLIIAICVSSCYCVFGQAPNISYQTPQVYTINTNITPLPPTNTGGAVPATIYGQVTTFAGSGLPGSLNATGTAATFNNPTRSAFDASGNLYVVDRDNNLIRKITPLGQVSTFASGGFSQPNGIAIDASGILFITDAANNAIKKVTPAGVISTFAGGSQGTANGTGTAASFYYPFANTFDSNGNMYVADTYNNIIRKISPAGVVTTYAGTGLTGANNGNAATATFNLPNSVSLDLSGNLYLTDPGNNSVRKISTSGIVTTFAGTGRTGTNNGTTAVATFTSPCGIAVDNNSGFIYVADLGNNLIRKISPTGIVSTLAGSGSQGAVNGTGTAASFNRPNDVTILSGNLYVTDVSNHMIRKVVITGYTIDQALPPGLSFDSTTGIISGKPTSLWPATVYTVTAYNVSGASSTTITISVVNTIPQTITFPPLPAVPYGTADLTPGATSTNSTIAITYTSSNPAVATISPDGKIHIVGAGQTTITASQAGNSVYSAASPVSQNLTVTPVLLTVTANNQTKVYGSANPAFTFTYTGFVNNDNETKLTTPPSASTSATQASGVGTYQIVPGNAVSTNYTFNYIAGLLTITPAPLTITANNQNRVYGTANPALSLSYGGFVLGEDAAKLTTQPVVSTTAITTSPIGQYPINVSAALSPNYTITYVNGVLTVNPVPRILTFNSIPDKNINDPDFDAGATVNTNDPIVYTSSNTAVATMVNGKIHITGLGTVTITANVANKTNYADVAPQSQQFSVTEVHDEQVFIHPVVTPNGDGINDVLRIDGIKNYPDNKLTLVNVNGIKVFEVSGYDNVKNVFEGHSNITGVFQPQGTYFYSLQYNVSGQQKKKSGYIVLKY